MQANMILTRSNGTSVRVQVQFYDNNNEAQKAKDEASGGRRYVNGNLTVDKSGMPLSKKQLVKEYHTLICGTLRPETHADRIALDSGARCAYCGREINATLIAKLPGIVPTFLNEEDKHADVNVSYVPVFCGEVCKDLHIEKVDKENASFSY